MLKLVEENTQALTAAVMLHCNCHLSLATLTISYYLRKTYPEGPESILSISLYANIFIYPLITLERCAAHLP